MTHTFDYASFQAQIPAYASAPPEAQVSAYFTQATFYVNPEDNWCGGLRDNQLQFALNLMTAHLIFIDGLITDGEDSVIVSGATIDKVTVSLMNPPVKDTFQYWLMTSPYGKKLAALLRSAFAGGFYVSAGLPERRAFRKVYGTFR
jgi:hypothetical protein